MFALSSVLILVAGVAVGLVLGLIGGGGSILTVPLLVYAVGLEAKVAIATSLLIVALTSVAGVALHHRRGDVAWRTGACFGLAGMLGAYGGGALARHLADAIQLLLFALVMMASGVAMLRRLSVTTVPVRRATRAVPRVLIDGMLCGLVTGVVGAGGGFLVVPALAILGGMSMSSAVGTSLMVIAMNSVAALAGYVWHAHVDVNLHAAFVISACAIAGTLIGAHLSKRIQPRHLQQGFGIFVLLVASILVVVEGSTMMVARVSLPRVPLEAMLAALMGVILVPLVVRALGHSARAAHRPAPPLDHRT